MDLPPTIVYSRSGVTKVNSGRIASLECKIIVFVVSYVRLYLPPACLGWKGREIVLRARLLPLLRSDGVEGVWSIELTFLSQLRNLVAGVGMQLATYAVLHTFVVIIRMLLDTDQSQRCVN